jgi:hypothetical protein
MTQGLKRFRSRRRPQRTRILYPQPLTPERSLRLPESLLGATWPASGLANTRSGQAGCKHRVGEHLAWFQEKGTVRGPSLPADGFRCEAGVLALATGGEALLTHSPWRTSAVPSRRICTRLLTS